MGSAYAHLRDHPAYLTMGEMDAAQILDRYCTPAQKAHSPDVALISSAIMLGYDRLVAQRQGGADALIRAAGLDPALCRNPFEQIEFAAFARLLELTARQLDCPDFGLRLGRLQSALVLMGPAGLALERADTIGDMFRYCSKLMHIYSTGLQVELGRLHGGETLLTYQWLVGETGLRRQVMEQLMVHGHRGVIDMTSGRACPKEIWFTHAPRASPQQYQQALPARIRFSQPCNALVFEAGDIAAPVRTGNRGAFESMLRSLSGHISEGVGLAWQVRRELCRFLHDDARSTREEIAQRLHLHPRTLHRRLALEGQVFDFLKDQTRRELAEHYLLQSAIPLIEVADRLGFAEPAVLTRACQRWFARTPSEMRASLGSAGRFRPSPAG